MMSLIFTVLVSISISLSPLHLWLVFLRFDDNLRDKVRGSERMVEGGFVILKNVTLFFMVFIRA